ncbi:tyrosine-type recombinase/integrase [Ancylobacter sp. IITR112]|uniref:tyrosine-type recombinase/integrase n=1 Tax=Ancylobacter sp. IITR112 TaxID=3138073 RepID=UPI00352B79D9
MASVAKREWTHKGETKTAWVVRYTDQGGKRRMKTFDKKRDADQYRNKVETEVERGEHIIPSRATTVRAACDAFIKQVEVRHSCGEVSAGWLSIVRNVINVHIVPALGARQLATLTIDDIQALHKRFLDRQSPLTAKQNMMILGQIERFAVRRKLTMKMPIKDYSADIGPTTYKPIRTFNIEHAKEILRLSAIKRKGCQERSYMFTRCMVEIAIFCGLRWGEIQALTVSSFDFDQGFIKVRQSLTRYDILKSPKTPSGVRDVPMPARVADLVKVWIDRFYLENERGLLFRTRTGTPYYCSHFHTWNWRPLLVDAGLPSNGDGFHHFHALRHFAASMMIEAGLAITDVASILGHRKFDMTLQVYAHPIVGIGRRHQAAEQIAEVLA